MRFSLASPTTAAFLVIMASRLLHLHFRGLLSVHSRYGPYAALPPFQEASLEVLQAICHLLARPKCFRPEREGPGGYCTHGTCAPSQGTHNNRCENAIRPFVVGRRAWLFCDTQAGADASARLYSLVESAKANSVEPHSYLSYLFTHLPSASTLEQYEALLPWNVKSSMR